MLTRRSLIVSGAATLLLPQAASGQVKRLPTELVSEIMTLPGRVILGNRQGDATLIEFFDYNCGFCKRSAADIRPLLQSDPNLRYILINYAVLGEASIEASRVALAHSMQNAQGGYLALHEALFRMRGRIDALRALAASAELGTNREKLITDADSDRVTDALKRAATLGENLGLSATPAFVAGREGVVGYVDLPAKRKALANLRRCEALAC
jgi:protein-disulfide isomerase